MGLIATVEVYMHTRDIRCVCGQCRIRRRHLDTGCDADFGPYCNNVARAGVFVHSTSRGQPVVLLVQSYNGKWGPPKGRVEPGESALECALRETHEETGLAIAQHVVDPSRARVLRGKWSMYEAVLPTPGPCTPQSDEITGIGWFTIGCIRHNRALLNHPAKLCLHEFMGVRM